jgi:hypothetical protein
MRAHYLAQASVSRSLPGLVFAFALLTAACGGSQTDVQTSTGAPPPSDTTEGEEGNEATEDAALLDVIADQETEILLDGKKIGTTPISAYKVTPGTHDVTFVDERNGNRTMTVTIGAGEAKTVKSDLPPRIQEQRAPDDAKK